MLANDKRIVPYYDGKIESMKKDRYIIQLLKEWLRGDAGYQKERELSDMAQDDPFLADALSGYQSLPEGNHEKQIVRIRQRLNKPEKRRVIPPIFLRVAAGGVILIAALFALRWVNDGNIQPISQEMTQDRPTEEAIRADEKGEDLAELTETASTIEKSNSFDDIEEKVAPAKPASASSNTPKEAKPKASSKKIEGRKPPLNEEGVTVAPSPKEKARAKEAAPSRKKVTPTSIAQPQPAETAAEADEATPNNISTNLAAEKEAVAIEEEAKSTFSDDPARNSRSRLSANRIISGSVTDESGQPLIGASINVLGTSTGTVTDLDGKFELPISAEGKEVQFAYTGYSPQRVPLIQNDTYNIQLSNPALLLDEVIVSGYTSKKRSKKDQEQSFTTIKAKSIQQIEAVGVKAAGGERKLNKTIRQQAKEVTVKSVLKGMSLQLSFTVDTNGKPANIRVLNSLSPLLNAEAVRLIELTEWQVLSSHAGKGGSVSCQLQF